MKGAKLLRWSAIAVGCWLGGQAHAAVNLALHCKTAISGTAVCDAGAMRWVTPSSTSRVQVEGIGWAMFDTVAAGTKVAVCAADIPPDSLYAACPQQKQVPKCEAAGQTCTADTSTFTADKMTGKAPLTVTLTWDCSNYTSAAASGSWTGTKSIKGTQTISALATSGAYTLTCNTPAKPAGTTGSAALSWIAPTQNTDNTVYSDAKGYFVYYDTDRAKVTVDATTGLFVPTALNYTVTGLAPATWFFAVRAVNSADIRSIPSAVVSKIVTPDVVAVPAKTWTKTLNVVVTTDTIPNPPTGLTVIDSVAYRYDQAQADKPRLFAIGTVPLKTSCDEKTQVMGLYRVPRSAVTFSQGASANIPLAKCG